MGPVVVGHNGGTAHGLLPPGVHPAKLRAGCPWRLKHSATPSFAVAAALHLGKKERGGRIISFSSFQAPNLQSYAETQHEHGMVTR